MGDIEERYNLVHNEPDDNLTYEDAESVGWDDKLAQELEDSIKGFDVLGIDGDL